MNTVILQNQTAKDLVTSLGILRTNTNMVRLSLGIKKQGEHHICSATIVGEQHRIDYGFLAKVSRKQDIVVNADKLLGALNALSIMSADIRLAVDDSSVTISSEDASLSIPLSTQDKAEALIGNDEDTACLLKCVLPGRNLDTLLKKGAKFSGKAGNEKMQNAVLHFFKDGRVVAASSNGIAAVVSELSGVSTEFVPEQCAQAWLGEKANDIKEEEKRNEFISKVMASQTVDELLAFARENGYDDSFSICLTEKTVSNIQKIIDEGNVEIIIKRGFLIVRSGSRRIICVLGGRTAGIEAVVNKGLSEDSYTMTLDRDALAKNIRVVRMFNEDSPLDISASASALNISCGKNKAVVPIVKTDCGNLSILCNGELLLQLISTYNSGNLTMSFRKVNTENSPFMVCDETSRGLIAVVFRK